jgi:hypothetical protein
MIMRVEDGIRTLAAKVKAETANSTVMSTVFCVVFTLVVPPHQKETLGVCLRVCFHGCMSPLVFCDVKAYRVSGAANFPVTVTCHVCVFVTSTEASL